MSTGSASDAVLGRLNDALEDLEALYKDIHSHPELSMQGKRTAGIAAARLREAGFEVTEGIGATGVVGPLENGDGPTVMLRADMDALPGKGGHRSALRQHSHRERPGRQRDAGDARLRP